MQMEKGTFRRSLELPTLGVLSGRVSGAANPAAQLETQYKPIYKSDPFKGRISYNAALKGSVQDLAFSRIRRER